MPLYSGVANTFDDLRTALVDSCVAEGWVWADSILSKGDAHVRPYVATTTTTTEGPGLIIQGGTGKSDGNLTGASDVRPRLGRPGAWSGYEDITFPVSYNVHVFSGPDEVFLVIKYNVDRFSWLAFGLSDVPGLPGTGLWLAGIARRGYMTSSGTGNGFRITPVLGGGSNDNNIGDSTGVGFFWNSNRRTTNPNARQDCIHANLDGEGWSGAGNGVEAGALNAIFPVAPMVEYSPSIWAGEAVLLPILAHVWRSSTKCSLVAQVRNARYVRVDNYDPEQIETLGDDAWIIYPFYLKNTTARDGGQALSHSGTFGWAIRYDGA